VEGVPLPLKPFHNVFSYVFGLLVFCFARLVYVTSKVETVGRRHLDGSPNHILCFWHLYSPLALAAFPRPSRQVWMQHPGWLNKHMHVVVRLFGVKVVLGSTGHGGREAADEIIDLLSDGYSTVVFPDAPRGPPCVLKDGVLHMARASGVPIVPVRFRLAGFLKLSGWDRKMLPLPFSSIRVEFGQPIRVPADDLQEARESLKTALGMPDD
jgi:lysophospholipid acyltransferase (LPLAT)-like uncharacterized protein